MTISEVTIREVKGRASDWNTSSYKAYSSSYCTNINQKEVSVLQQGKNKPLLQKYLGSIFSHAPTQICPSQGLGSQSFSIRALSLIYKIYQVLILLNPEQDKKNL